MTAEFAPLKVLGMMSGTSFDGVDAAVLETDGESVIRFGESGFEAYSDEARSVLRGAMGSWPGAELGAAEAVVLEAHGRLAAGFDADLIGFHGQTLAHDPDQGRTHQLGSGAALAQATGRDVVWDFRSADMEAGGQGAPLAPFFHHALARLARLEAPVAFLNLGGVANITWVDPAIARPEADGALLAFDTGPANALLDDFVSRRAGVSHDKGGEFAARGQVLPEVLAALEGFDYLDRPAPKSLDRDDFKGLERYFEDVSLEDGTASLTAVTAQTVAASCKLMPAPPARWFVCGGGRHNGTMMAMISEAVGVEMEPVEVLGFDGDMLEAQAFAWLAVRVLRGLPTSAPSTTGCTAPICGGRVARVS